MGQKRQGGKRMKHPWLAAGITIGLSFLTLPAHGSDVLVVAPGKVAGLRMGASTQDAKRGGWIKWDQTCSTWTTGPRTYRTTPRGGEVFKAFPEKVRAGHILSMWATGDVVTSKGIRAASLRSGRAGSGLAALRRTYPNLQRLGWWAPGADWQISEDVYTVGSRQKGWLDLYVDTETRRVSMMLIRDDAVSWRAFKGADGC